jgi:3-dehydroquinate dehydratase/shikimate dehydrogenase
METKLAVPIAAGDLEQARHQIKAATEAGAEMLELRTDYLENLSVDLVKGLIAEAKSAGRRSPSIIVTCRDKRQGGVKDYPLKLRIDVLSGAVRAGAEFIDFEYENFVPVENREKIKAALSQNAKAKLILSAHSFDGPFRDGLESLYRDIVTYPGVIPKLIYTANHINDCFEAFDLLEQSSGERIVFCMGEAGLISRIVAKKLGSLLTFASIDEQSGTAPGQLTIEQLRRTYRWDSIDAKTELYGVIGCPVAHSFGPAVHNRCFEDIGANKLYLPLLVGGGMEEFDKFMMNILRRRWLDFRGFSVTIPHKERALEFVEHRRGYVEPLTKRIGALNTMLIEADVGLGAYNTDHDGALGAITSSLGISRDGLKSLTVAVIGAGGAARTVVAGLGEAGAQIKIYNRTVERAEKLAAEFGCSFGSLDELATVDAKLIANCTGVGMYPNVDATPLPKECIKKDMAVFDAVYNPEETKLLKEAREAGARTISGLEMFVKQALAQFRLFTGQEANAELMRKITGEFL